MEVRICQLPSCGNEFKPHITNVKKGHGKFCSQKCWAKYRHLASLVTKICKVCGVAFKGKKKRITCSKSCGTKWMVMSRKKRTTYRNKTIIGNITKEEADIIRDLRAMPEIIPKITTMLNARKTMIRVYGRFINERVVKDR